VFVTELSSFQLEAIDHFRPRAAALLNLAADHLDRYAVVADYAAAKRRLFRRQEKDDVAVLNADDPEVAAVATVAAARPRLFSRRGPIADGCYLDGERVIEVDPGEGSRLLFTAADVPLAGVHNLENAMAAALLARAMGAAPEAMRGGLRGFRGLPHRVQRVAERRGVTWYDDSKGTNPAATVKSLEGFPDRSVHLILGGRKKGADPRELATAVGRKARWVYFVGEAGAEFAAALGHLAPGEMAGTLDRAVEAAARRAVAGEVVLLSPACASFDQYTSYAERGDHFQRLVRELDRPRAARGG
jgi:UDP-N-acetylmuramoylalanine--D-glutamate ligase